MMTQAAVSRRWLRMGLGAAAALVIGLGGCQGSGPGKASGRLGADDFRGPPAASVPVGGTQGNGEGATGSPRLAAAPRVVPASPSDVVVLDVVGTPGPPANVAPNPKMVDKPVMLDALVGQINGRPVCASEFLSRLDKRLAGMVKKLDNDTEWRLQARKIIYDELLRRIRDQLILAEAQAALTPDQRKGLFQFLQHLREDIISHQGGSEQLANQSLEASEQPLDLDATVKDELDQKLIVNEWRMRIGAKVNVSWRDVQLEYERNADKYQPAPKAILRMIWVPATDKPTADQIAARLAAGAEFRDVAADAANEFNRGEAGLAERTFRGDYAKAEFFGPPELNGAARQLTPGATVGPIAYKDKTAWLHLDAIEQPPARSLYDVQLEISNELHERRFAEETSRYFERLLRKGSFSKIPEMTERLAAIAGERYLVNER